MLKKVHILLLVMMQFAAINALGQQVQAELLIRNQQLVADTFFFDIYLQRTGTKNVFLENADFSLGFNTSNFNNPQFYFSYPSSELINSNGSKTAHYDANISAKFVNYSYNENELHVYLKPPAISNQTQFNDRIARIDDSPLKHKIGTFYITGISDKTEAPGLFWKTGKLRGVSTKVFTYDSASWNSEAVDITTVNPALAGSPTVASSSINFTNITATSMKLNWVSGNGGARIVLARAGAAVGSNHPIDGLIYEADTVFGSGSRIGNDVFVVYNSAGSFVNISGLDPHTEYHFAVYEYNGTSGWSENYFTSGALTGSATTSSAIVAMPEDVNICEGEDARFAVTADGVSLAYQWQQSTDSGNNWINLSGSNNDTLELTGVNAGMDSYLYRAIVSGSGIPNDTSDAATLTVAPATAITAQPASEAVCGGFPASFAASASGTTLSYQWQESADSGSTWGNLGNSGVYSGADTALLQISSASSGMSGYRYRCIAMGDCSSDTTAEAVLVVYGNGTWAGSVGSSWHTTANWCGGLPDSATDVTIPAGVAFMPEVNDFAFCKNLIIEPGASLVMNDSLVVMGSLDAQGTLDIGGNELMLHGALISNSGISSTSSSVLKLYGTGSITLPALSLQKLYINKSDTITMTGNINITGTLNLISGTLQTGNKSLTITQPVTLNAGAILEVNAGGTFNLWDNLTLNGGKFRCYGTCSVAGDIITQ